MIGTSKLIVATFIAATTFFSVYANSDPKHWEGEGNRDRYCAKIKDGKKIVMHNGLRMNKDVTLSNGTRILTDGTIIKLNGARATLTSGECMTKEGIIMQEEIRSEIPKEKGIPDVK